MGKDIKEFLEEIQTPIKKFNITELREREEIWRALWSWIGEEIQYYVIRIGSKTRIVKRDYKGVMGELGACKFELSEIEVLTQEKVYNFSDGQYYFEDKVVKIPASAIMFKEFLFSQELIDPDPLPEVAPLKDDIEDEINALNS